MFVVQFISTDCEAYMMFSFLSGRTSHMKLEYVTLAPEGVLLGWMKHILSAPLTYSGKEQFWPSPCVSHPNSFAREYPCLTFGTLDNFLYAHFFAWGRIENLAGNVMILFSCFGGNGNFRH